MRLNVKLSEVQLLRSQATVHTLPLLVRERKFYGRAHVKITRQWKSTARVGICLSLNVYSYFETVCRKKCARDNPER